MYIFCFQIFFVVVFLLMILMVVCPLHCFPKKGLSKWQRKTALKLLKQGMFPRVVADILDVPYELIVELYEEK